MCITMHCHSHHDATVVEVRTTCTLDDDVAAAVERFRREHGVGFSETINRLIRAGLVAESPRHRYEHRTHALGLKVDVTDIGGVLDLLDDT